MSDTEFNTESIYALSRIPVDTFEAREALESAIVDIIGQLETVKWPRGLQYFENASFLQGNHLTRFYYTTDGFGIHRFGTHDNSSFDSLIAKVADNRLIRPVESVVSLLTQNRPHPRVEPNSNTPEDEDAAALAEIVLDLVWDRPLNMQRVLREAAFVGCICGTAAIEVEYGDSNSPVVVPEYKLESRPDEMFEGEEVFEQVQTGNEIVELRSDIMARVWTPFHIIVDPAATSPEDMTWVCRSTYEDVDWIKETFDRPDDPGYFTENLDKIGPTDTKHSVLYWWAKVQDIIESPQYYQHGGGLAPQTFTTNAGYAPDQTTFRVIDVRPSTDHPRGRTIILAGDKIIYAGDARAFIPDPDDPGRWRYPWRWHPYAFWSWLKLPGKFWGVALLSELVPLQKRINSDDALIQANRQYMAIGQWLIPNHCRVPDGWPSGVPGHDMRYNAIPGAPIPERVQAPPMPSELYEERGHNINSMESIAASGATDGKQIAPSAARAGVILDFMRQERLRSKSPMLQDYEDAVELVAQNILIELQANLTDEDPDLTLRVQRAARDHSSLALAAFTGLSLRDHHSVSLDIAAAAMKSPEAKEAKALEVIQYIGPSLSAEERRGLMAAVGADEFIRNKENSAVNRARRMISRIGLGMFEAVYPMPGVDVPSIMAPVFQNAILGDRFHDLEEEAQAKMVEMFMLYRKMAAEDAQAARQQQIALAQAGVKPPTGAQQPK